jgi:hypothetical protein
MDVATADRRFPCLSEVIGLGACRPVRRGRIQDAARSLSPLAGSPLDPALIKVLRLGAQTAPCLHGQTASRSVLGG